MNIWEDNTLGKLILHNHVVFRNKNHLVNKKFSPLSSRVLLRAYQMPGIVGDAGGTPVNKTDRLCLSSWGSSSNVGD